MPSIIVSGLQEGREEYVKKIVSQNSIPAYSIRRLEGTIKIADVHNILRSIRVHAGKNEKRLVIFSGQLTIPSQNALLKFLEELNDSEIVVFSVDSKELLLDTIVSRCRVIMLNADDKGDEGSNYDGPTKNINFSELLYLAEKITTKESFEEIILLLRKQIISDILVNNPNNINDSIALLRYLHENYRLVKENNVNPKLVLEAAYTSEMLASFVRK